MSTTRYLVAGRLRSLLLIFTFNGDNNYQMTLVHISSYVRIVTVHLFGLTRNLTTFPTITLALNLRQLGVEALQQRATTLDRAELLPNRDHCRNFSTVLQL